MKIVVIGAGVAGLAIGWRLAQAGQEVTVLERGQPGRGATWASRRHVGCDSRASRTQPPVKWSYHANYSNALWPEFCEED